MPRCDGDRHPASTWVWAERTIVFLAFGDTPAIFLQEPASVKLWVPVPHRAVVLDAPWFVAATPLATIRHGWLSAAAASSDSRGEIAAQHIRSRCRGNAASKRQ